MSSLYSSAHWTSEEINWAARRAEHTWKRGAGGRPGFCVNGEPGEVFAGGGGIGGIFIKLNPGLARVNRYLSIVCAI